MRASFFIVASTATVFSAQAATLDISTLATGTQFTKCIKTTDYETKKITDPVEVADYLSSGCCPDDFIPGVKHYNKYYGAQVICGFQDDGTVSATSKTSSGATTCTYNKCFVVNLNGHTCKDGSKMTINGCCPKDQWQADCKMYSKSQTLNKKKVNYCLSYAKSYKMEGTSDKKDDITSVSTLSLDNLYVYTPCTGVRASGVGSAYTLMGDGACHNAASSPGTGALKFKKSTDKVATACAAACAADSTCTGYDTRATGCVYYKVAITKSNAASTAYKCYKKGSVVVASPTPSSPTPASPTPASPTPASPTPASPTPASATQFTTLDISTLATGTQFTKCIKTTDYETKKITESVQVADYLSNGCCPDDSIPGVKHYNKYYGAQVICGFQDDGAVSASAKTSNGATTCTYNKCFVVNLNGHTCKDGSKMTINGCCPKDQWQADCKMYSKSQTLNKKKVNYCLSYAKSYKMEGTVDTKDDITSDGKLSLDNLYVFTPCTGVSVVGAPDGTTDASGAVQAMPFLVAFAVLVSALL